MIYLKKFKYYIKENIDIDPFDEEDWDEIDINQIPIYIEKLRKNDIEFFEIPINILKHLNDISFDILNINNNDNIIKLSVKLFNLIKNDNNQQLLFSKIIEKLNSKEDFYYLLKYKNNIENFEILLSNSISLLFNNINDIDFNFIKKLNKIIDFDIYQLLNDINFINNISGETLYKIINQYNYNIDLDDIELIMFNYEPIIYLIGKLYLNNKIIKNSLTAFCLYLNSGNDISSTDVYDFYKKIGMHKNENNEYFIIYDNYNDLEYFFYDNKYTITMTDYWELFNYDYDLSIQNFTNYLNIDAILYFVNLFKKFNIGDFSNFNLKNIGKNKIELQKLKNYLENIISDGINDKFKTDLDFNELVNNIKRCLRYAQSEADASEYFKILSNHLEKYFDKWKENNKIYKWININNKDYLGMKPNLDFLNEIELSELTQNYGFDFSIYDLIDYLLGINGKISPDLNYINGYINKDIFSGLIFDYINL